MIASKNNSPTMLIFASCPFIRSEKTTFTRFSAVFPASWVGEFAKPGQSPGAKKTL